MIFGEYSDIVENDILTMERFLDVSRFLYSPDIGRYGGINSGLSTLPDNLGDSRF